MTDSSSSTAFKNWMNYDLLVKISESIYNEYSVFDKSIFVGIHKEFDKLELKPRVHLIALTLKELLPENYTQSLKILISASENGRLKGFELWPITHYIQLFGTNHLHPSLNAMRVLTQKFTSEFSIRPFLKLHQIESIKYLEECSKSKNEHIRRWASEGTRPRLPWGEKFEAAVSNPSITKTILNNLKFDESLYVRKSVANHLNDISKNHPHYVIKLLKRWKSEASNSDQQERLQWLSKHALRTLIKQGHPSALSFLGVKSDAKFRLNKFKIERANLKIGEVLRFQFELKNLENNKNKFVVDYIVYHKLANGKLSPKVFKLKTISLNAKTTASIQKNHSLKPITTRKYRNGEHRVSIQVNGKIAGTIKWELKT